jgi:hypothetical protein
MLATSPDPAVKNATEALYLAGHADQLTHGMDPMVLRILAASRAACGRSAEAAETAQHALSVTRQNPALRRELEGEIKIYRDAASHIAAAGRD